MHPGPDTDSDHAECKRSYTFSHTVMSFCLFFLYVLYRVAFLFITFVFFFDGSLSSETN